MIARVRRTALLLLIVILTAGGSMPALARTSPGVEFSLEGTAAFAGSIRWNGCVGTFTYVELVDVTSAGPIPDDEDQPTTLTVSIDRFNVCTGESLLYAGGQTALRPNQYTLHSNAALVNASVEVCDFSQANGRCRVVDVVMEWRGRAGMRDTFRWFNRFQFEPGCSVSTFLSEQYTLAAVRGTVSGWFNQPIPGFDGGISEVSIDETYGGCFVS
jgi:hypothetical protein